MIPAGTVIFSIFNKDSASYKEIEGFRSLNVDAWLNNGTVISNSYDARTHDYSAEPFTISINNGLLRYSRLASLVEKNYCITEDGIAGDKSPSCRQDSQKCAVYINYHGWDASVYVRRETLYKTPEVVCSILRTNLDAWTLSIDDLRSSKAQDF